MSDWRVMTVDGVEHYFVTQKECIEFVAIRTGYRIKHMPWVAQ